MAEAVLVELHDVSPHSWSLYRAFIDEVEAVGPVPLNWLVVPDYHRRGTLEADPGLRDALEQRLSQGDELILHGYSHVDEAPPPRSPRQWWLRRQFTHEGEFAALSEAEAARRLERGQALFQRLGWPLHGFIAPGWLLGPSARRAVARSGLSYTADLHRILRLPDFESLDAPALVWSAGTRWRRRLSRRYCDLRLARHADAPLIRLGIHPVDLRHAEARRYWLTRLHELIAAGRSPVTAHRWLGSVPHRHGAMA